MRFLNERCEDLVYMQPLETETNIGHSCAWGMHCSHSPTHLQLLVHYDGTLSIDLEFGMSRLPDQEDIIEEEYHFLQTPLPRDIELSQPTSFVVSTSSPPPPLAPMRCSTPYKVTQQQQQTQELQPGQESSFAVPMPRRPCRVWKEQPPQPPCPPQRFSERMQHRLQEKRCRARLQSLQVMTPMHMFLVLGGGCQSLPMACAHSG